MLRDGAIIQVLDWLADIINLSCESQMGVKEISLMGRSDDSDTFDYLEKVLGRVDKLMSVK